MDTREAIQLLEEVMAIPSVNSQDDEGKVAEYLKEYFRKHGIEADVERFDDTHANVTAVLEGENTEEPLFLNGHLDTVPYGAQEDWESDPSLPDIRDGYLYGRGASDMKSGLCAMVYAMCSCRKAGKKPARSVVFLGTCDEEKGGLGADTVHDSGMLGSHPKLIVGEPTGMQLGIAQRGCIWLILHGHGKTSHGAYPQEGCNAVVHTWHIAEKISGYVSQFTHPVLGRSTASVTEISGGTAPNMIPETCEILMDIRFTPGMTDQMLFDMADQFIREENEASKGIYQASISLGNNRMALEVPGDAELVQDMKKCLQEEGMDPECIGLNFFTDASRLVRDLREPEVLLFGPGHQTMAHKPNECVKLDDYLKTIRVLERMITL